ncbi:hypothetical protein GJAV_G00004450 [Gymnothorax javanicus]|nr:hypothetical protein GJAV_G00004450 [Gymnothorax javanicus]
MFSLWVMVLFLIGGFAYLLTEMPGKKGSCVTILGTLRGTIRSNGSIVWLKNAIWNDAEKDYEGTVVYSLNSDKSVKSEFSGRVNESFNDDIAERKLTICELRLEDSGSYGIRYYSNPKPPYSYVWMSEILNLVVVDVPAAVWITKSKDDIIEGDTFSLTCHVEQDYSSHLSYSWYRDGTRLENTGPVHHFRAIQINDNGSYYCQATNFAGSRESEKVKIRVEYGPRNTQIKTSCCERGVPVSKSLTLTCEANANPQPHSYTWFRKVRQPDGARSQEWTEAHYWADQPFLTWERIKISDAGMYMCQARNKINAENSSSLCVDVLYRPRGLTLSMSPSVRDSSLVAIHCTVESFPPSNLTITWSPYSNRHLSNIRKTLFPKSFPGCSTTQSVHSQNLTISFNASDTDAGWYTCRAWNTEGENEATQQLVVNYAPKDVRATVSPGGEVNENTNLNLTCQARSNPSVTSYTWFRLRAGREGKVGVGKFLTLSKVSEAETGLYFCRTRNEIGERNSSIIHVTVRYGPTKPVIFSNSTSRGQAVKESAVVLMCSSQSYPPIQTYTWYIKEQVNKERVIGALQNLTISFDKGGLYSCIVNNGISSSSSGWKEISFQRSSTNILIMANVCTFFIILIIIIITILVCKKRRKSSQQSLQNDSRNGTWETLVMDGMGDPQRSREALSAVVSPPLQPPANQHGPERKPCSSVQTVYSALKHSGKTQQCPGTTSRDGGGTQEELSINYAALHFPGQSKDQKLVASNEAVYTSVSKPNRRRKDQGEEMEYENVKQAVPRQRVQEAGMRTWEDDVSYTTLSFAAETHRTRHHSDSSDEDFYHTDYSQVKA